MGKEDSVRKGQPNGYAPLDEDGLVPTENLPIYTLASSDFVNQGTTTTVLHGNAAGNPSWGSVVEDDMSLSDNTTGNVSNDHHGFQAKDSFALFAKQILTASSGTYTPTAGTRAIFVKAVGAGGGGGGAAYGSGQVGAGAGGVGGGYCEKLILSIAANYAYACGAGGVGGAAGANAGTAGGDTTFDSITAKGGSGGSAGTAYSPPVIYDGGTETTGTTGGDINVQGRMAGPRLTLSTTYLMGGRGGDSVFGRGGKGAANGGDGGNAQGYGAGGGGASSVASTNKAGGNGGGGLIVIYEFK